MNAMNEIQEDVTEIQPQVSDIDEIIRARQLLERVVAGDFEVRLTGIQASEEVEQLLQTVNDLIDRCDA